MDCVCSDLGYGSGVISVYCNYSVNEGLYGLGMGINIFTYRLLEHVSEPNGNYPPHQYWKKERYEDWDWGRHTGDREFASADFEWIEVVDNPDSHDFSDCYNRPKDIDKAIEWVNKNIQPEGNRQRLINLLEAMRIDDKLFIHCSY